MNALHAGTGNNKENVIDRCVEIAGHFINRAQAEADGVLYADEFDEAVCNIYSTVLYCIEHRMHDFNADMAKGLFLAIVAGYVSGQMPEANEYEKLAQAMADLVRIGCGKPDRRSGKKKQNTV